MMTIFCFIAFWPCCETLSWKLPKFILYLQKIKERSKIVYFIIPYHPDESCGNRNSGVREAAWHNFEREPATHEQCKFG
jgi:hypothetical protein